MPKKTPRFRGEVKDGKFQPEDPIAFMKQIRSLDGKTVWASMEEWKEFKHRSLNENSYYHGVVIDILSSELGYTHDEMHEVIKWKFLAHPIELKGQKVMTAVSTASLSTSEFEGLMAKIRTWASMELGIYIPEPNEVPYNFFG